MHSDISGNTIVIRLDQLSRNLDEKADWMMENIRRREWVKDGENGWFNGYYDDHKRPVERAEKQPGTYDAYQSGICDHE